MGDAFVFFAVLLVSEDQSRVGDLCVITVSKGARFSVAQLLDEVDVLGREWCCSGVSAVVLGGAEFARSQEEEEGDGAELLGRVPQVGFPVGWWREAK